MVPNFVHELLSNGYLHISENLNLGTFIFDFDAATILMIRCSLFLLSFCLFATQPLFSRANEHSTKLSVERGLSSTRECNFELEFDLPNYPSTAFGEATLHLIVSTFQAAVNSDTTILEPLTVESAVCTDQVLEDGRRLLDSSSNNPSNHNRELTMTPAILNHILGQVTCTFCPDDDDRLRRSLLRGFSADENAGRHLEALSDLFCEEFFLALGTSDPMINDSEFVRCAGTCGGIILDGMYCPKGSSLCV